jgi:hypothetical protein
VCETERERERENGMLDVEGDLANGKMQSRGLCAIPVPQNPLDNLFCDRNETALGL